MNPRVAFTLKSGNRKTGPIPVTTTENITCPDSCPFKAHICYAKSGWVGKWWREVNKGTHGDTWEAFLLKVRALPVGQLWRHNQAGDLPGINERLDVTALRDLVDANVGRRGFTFTHKRLAEPGEAEAIREANRRGFTVNLSGNSLADADTLLELNAGPVTCVLPESVHGNADVKTPNGAKVVVCPATYRDEVTCQTCQLCSRANRKVIVGFPVHGPGAPGYEKAVPV